MSRTLIAYVATLIVFAVVDFIWLGFIAKDWYRNAIGPLMADKPNLAAAVVFYLLYIVGLMYFAVMPAFGADEWQRAALNAALLGLIAYATYDLTNLATLRGWPVSIVVADLVWGTFVSAVAATAGFFMARALTR